MESVALFVTCLVDIFRPQAGQAAVRILERRGARVAFPADQTCCGQFSYNAGYWREAADLARHWVEVFEAVPSPIVALSGSCAAMVIKEYPDLLYRDAVERGEPEAEAERWRQRATAVAERVIELSQWVVSRDQNAGDVPLEPAQAVALHRGCHMQRLLKAGDAPARALRLNALTPVELQDSDQCCGFGGTYSMTEWPVSTALADAKWAAIQKACQAGAKALTSADLGCLLHLAGRQSRVGGSLPVVYVAELIDWADAHSLDEKLGPQSAKEES